MLLIDTIQSLSLSDKRALVKTIKSIISEEVKDKKVMAVFAKQAKENAKKAKIQAQINAAAEKLAKLQAKLA
jgi:type II secretory pathway predicted ATPase ExeA